MAQRHCHRHFMLLIFLIMKKYTPYHYLIILDIYSMNRACGLEVCIQCMDFKLYGQLCQGKKLNYDMLFTQLGTFFDAFTDAINA